jgi:beta-lactamase class D
MFKLIQKETNQYAKQQINKKQEGCLSPKSIFALWHSLTARNKKILCNNHTHERVIQVISEGLLEFASDYSHPIRSFCWNVSG